MLLQFVYLELVNFDLMVEAFVDLFVVVQLESVVMDVVGYVADVVIVVVVNGTGQTGTRAGSIGGRHGRVRIVRAIRLGGWQAEGREFVTGQQGPFGGVVVVPRDFSRTSGMDLRDRRELQLFGWTRTAREESWALDEWMCPTRDGKSSGKATRKAIQDAPNAMQSWRVVRQD